MEIFLPFDKVWRSLFRVWGLQDMYIILSKLSTNFLVLSSSPALGGSTNIFLSAYFAKRGEFSSFNLAKSDALIARKVMLSILLISALYKAASIEC